MLNSFLFPIAVALTAALIPAQITALSGAPVLGDPRPRLPGGLGDCVAHAIADFDGDGRLDLLRASEDRIAVLVQGSSGVFEPVANQPSSTLTFAAGVRAVATGDFDGDGDRDIAVGLLGSADVLLLNDGSARFVRAPVGSIPPGGFLATAGLVAGDFDGVSGDDLLVLPVNGAPRLLLHAGGAAFVDASFLLPGAASQARSVAAACDFDRDGSLDLVLGGTALAPTLVLFNNGTGNFTQGVIPIAAAAAVAAVATADLDSDRAPELVLAAESTLATPPIVMRVSRAGSSRVPPTAASIALAGWLDLALGDVDGDGLADCIGLDAGGALWTAPGTGTGGFLAGVRRLDGGSRRRLLAVDLDSDLDLDLMVFGGTLSDALLLGTGLGTFVSTEDETAPSSGNFAGARAAILDVSGEGDPDVLMCSVGGRFALWLNDGGARFRPSAATPPDLLGLGAVSSLLPARLVGGGAARDLFVIGQPGVASATGVGIYGRPTAGVWLDRSALFLGTQVGRIFSAATIATLGLGRATDAASDLLLGDVAGTVSVHRNDGTSIRELSGALPLVHAGSIGVILTGDLDEDGAADIVVLPSSGVPVVHLARGAARLQFVERPGAITTLAPAIAGALVDLDRDGHLDLFCATPGSSEGVALLHGVGDGTFVDVTQPELGPLLPITAARAVAVLGPADAQRVVIARHLGEPMLLARRAIGGFVDVGPIEMHGTSSVRELRVADLDLDGDDDLLAIRDDAGPALLLRSDRGLAARGPAQSGKRARFDLTLPAGRVGFVLFSPFTTRVPLPGYGLLRLVGPTSLATVVSPPGGATSLEFAIPPGLGGFDLPLQLVSFDAAQSDLVLCNLEIVKLTDA